MRSGSRRRWIQALLVCLAVSLAFHAGLYALLLGSEGGDEPLVAFRIPDTVEFGLTDGDGEPAPAPAPPPAPPLPVQAQPLEKARPTQPLRDLVVAEADEDAIRVDASVPPEDAGVQMEPAEATVDGGTDAVTREGPQVAALSGTGYTPGATGDGLGVGAGGHGLGGFAPPGASIGLHVDVARVMDSSLSLETEALIGVIPAWQAVLAGSGLQPLSDFSRLFVATPNLMPSHLVIAGRIKGGQAAVARGIATLARERGRDAPVVPAGPLSMAPWHSRGATDRSIASSPAGDIIISRTSDMPRVLAVARALEARRAKGALAGTDGAPDALLAMYRDEAVALSIEGVRRFVVGDPPGMPRHVRISVRPIDEFYAGMRVLGAYGSAAEASAAEAYAEQLRTTLVDHPKVIYLGLKSALQKASLQREGRFLVLDARITLHQTRYLLQYLTRLLQHAKRG